MKGQSAWEGGEGLNMCSSDLKTCFERMVAGGAFLLADSGDWLLALRGNMGTCLWSAQFHAARGSDPPLAATLLGVGRGAKFGALRFEVSAASESGNCAIPSGR